jgi:predicted glycosyltransferase
MQINNIANARIFIKTRPHESKKTYQEFESVISCGSIHLVSKEIDIDLFDLLYASDIMITSLSTTNLDALAVATPVVTIVVKKNIYNDKRRLKLETWRLPVIKEKKKIYQTISAFFDDKNTRTLWKRAASIAGESLIANYPKAAAGERINSLIRIFNKKHEL